MAWVDRISWVLPMFLIFGASQTLGSLYPTPTGAKEIKKQFQMETTCYDKDNQIVHVNVATEVTLSLDEEKGENTIKKCIIVVK
jgi:hypothetical protein